MVDERMSVSAYMSLYARSRREGRFDTRFASKIDVPAALKTLPTLGGAGKVRELQQAAAQSASLADVLDLDRYAGSFLSSAHRQGLTDFDQWVAMLPPTAGWQKSRCWRDGDGSANEMWRMAA